MTLMSLKGIEEFINPEITSFLKGEGFIFGQYDDPYSGAKNPSIYYKRLGKNNYDDSLTVIITKDEIAIEREHSYGGGDSAGLINFTENDAESFTKAWNDFAEKAKSLGIV